MLKISRRTMLIIEIIVLIAIISYFAYYEIHYALSINDYISDECWYVSAARNIFRKVFNLTPPYRGEYVRVTIEFTSPPSSDEYHKWVEDAEHYIKDVLGGKIIKDDTYYAYNENGNYLPAICADIPKNKLDLLKNINHLRQYAIGYCYPNANGILDYLNLEHPPLVKYIIGLAMMIGGDWPIVWRIPSIIVSIIILIMVYIVVKKILWEDSASGLLALAAVAALEFDITFRSLGMVAMLDIYVAFFTYLTYFMLLMRKLDSMGASLGFGFSCKFNGAFPAIAILYEEFRRREPYLVLLTIILLPATIFLALSLPLIFYLGLGSWWENSVVGAIRWHLSIKTTGGPPQAPPWYWFFGINAFPLHLVYNKETGKWVADLIARGNPPLYVLTLALSIYVLPVFRKMKDGGITYTYTWITYLMYIVIWLLGSKTQYSFYMVQIVPLLYTLLFLEIHYVLTPLNNFINIAKEWIKLFKNIGRWLKGEVRLRICVEEVRAERPALESKEATKEPSEECEQCIEDEVSK